MTVEVSEKLWMLRGMKDFLDGRESLESLLARFDVGVEDIPGRLVSQISRRDLSHDSIWAWCQAAELFGRSQRLTGLLCHLVARDDHYAHEDLANTLQNLRDPATVEVLYDRATRPLEYLAYNDSSALARKCIWALHDIGTSESIGRLSDLANDPREQVAGWAAGRIEALKSRAPGEVKPYRISRDARLGSL